MSTSRAPRVIALATKAATGLIALVIAVALYMGLVAIKPKPKTIENERPPILVSVVPAALVQVSRTWEGFGTAQPMDSADVSAQVTARVIERADHIEPGNRIDKGDIIVRLDPIEFEQRLESATQLVAAIDADLAALDIEQSRLAQRVKLASEELAVRRREYDRAVAALEDRAGNVTEVEVRLAVAQRTERDMIALEQQADLIVPRRAKLSAQLAGADADVVLAQENLDRTEIRAPITGTLQSVAPEIGELLTQGQAVARIVNLTRLEVPLRLPASSANDIAPGALVTLRPDGPSPAMWRGNVARIAPESDPSTRMITVFVEVQQNDNVFGGNLMPGRFVVGSVESSNATSHIIIPRNAVRKGRVTIARQVGNNYEISLANVDIAFYISGVYEGIDPDESQWVVIESGLVQGDNVVLTSLELTPGQPVRIQSVTTARVQSTPDQGGM